MMSWMWIWTILGILLVILLIVVIVKQLITHDAESERKLAAATHPQIYRQFMWNDFVVVGPASDHAGIRKSRTAPEAFRRI